MIRCNAAMTTSDVISDFTRVTVAPGIRLSGQFSDWRNAEKEPVEKEQRDPQAHLARSMDSGEHAAAPLVDDNDLSDRDFSQRGVVCAKFNRPQPIAPRGSRSLSYTNGTARIVVKGELHLGKWPFRTWR